ncbi:phage Gp37/Gp68 family protein [Sporomusa sphaeroides DSM 2875]|uniref:DUF5131 family protein n=1 Tax=Sporomusa sphaeroides TaxID=47679 RepID=UPI0020301AA3|nr:phage Gp37/Gp68 family protein [Sporomusa sphaeroides]MCM0760476.1 phage Gp37/Gp68 family protein [Sporomusa sphaeroides DSM 2875]
MPKSRIEWTDRVWNPITGCTPISPGCDNCYAERMSRRFAETWGLPADNPFKVTLHPERLEQPLNWKKACKIFVCSMSDLFHDDIPDDFIMQVFSTMAHAQWYHGHIFIILTKRPERMKRIIETIKTDIEKQQIPIRNENGTTTRRLTFAFPLQNIWLGVTAENQEQAEKRIPILLQTPAVKRLVSVEPMLSKVQLHPWWLPYHSNHYLHYSAHLHRGLDWVICGGESGPGARPMHPDWARSLQDQCQAAGVSFFFKQWGEFCAISQMTDDAYRAWDCYHGTEHCWDMDNPIWKVGKKKAGCLLDGQEWKQFPGR